MVTELRLSKIISKMFQVKNSRIIKLCCCKINLDKNKWVSRSSRILGLWIHDWVVATNNDSVWSVHQLLTTSYSIEMSPGKRVQSKEMVTNFSRLIIKLTLSLPVWSIFKAIGVEFTHLWPSNEQQPNSSLNQLKWWNHHKLAFQSSTAERVLWFLSRIKLRNKVNSAFWKELRYKSRSNRN